MRTPSETRSGKVWLACHFRIWRSIGFEKYFGHRDRCGQFYTFLFNQSTPNLANKIHSKRDNLGTVVSYLKGVLLILQNYGAVLTDVMILADCEDFISYMKLIYFVSKRYSSRSGYIEYLDSAETYYRILYQKGRWIKAVDPSESGFVGDSEEGGNRYYRGEYGGRVHGRDAGYRRGGHDTTRK